jgi:hypothetical protein
MTTSRFFSKTTRGRKTLPMRRIQKAPGGATTGVTAGGVIERTHRTQLHMQFVH